MDLVLLTLGYFIIFSVSFKILSLIYFHLALRKKLSSIPGPKGLPFIGIAPILQKIPTDDLFLWTMDLCFQYKNGMVITWLGTQPILHIRKPNQIEIILRSQTLIRKSEFYHFLSYWLGNGLLTSTGDVWHRNRRLMTPAFHFAVLDQFAGVIYDKTEILNEILKEKVKNDPNKPVNIFLLAIKFTLDTVCKTVMGVDLDLQRQPENDYVMALHKFTRLTIYRFVRILYRSDFIFNRTSKGKKYNDYIKKMHAFTRQVINEKNKLRKEKKIQSLENVKKDDDDLGKRKTKAFLDLLMDLSEADENPLSLEEIREHVDTFMFGAHDTTGTALTWILFNIGNYPEIQKKIHDELDSVFGNDDTPCNKQQLTELKYLDRVIKESLRLYPSAPVVSRILDHNVIIDNHVIPKGITVNVEIAHLHRDPEIWDNPEKFDPDRFLPENSRGRHPYAYIPFSAGPRNCIGLKFASLVLKIALIGILRKWAITSALKPEQIKLNADLILTPPDQRIDMYFKPRKF